MQQLMHEGDPVATAYIAIAFGLIIVVSALFGAHTKEGSSKNGDVSKELNPDLFSSRSPDNFH